MFELYWDGATEPSVSVPLGDFFGVGHATGAHCCSLPLNCPFGDRRGPKGPFSPAMNCYFPMPFGSAAKVQIVNEADKPIENLFYYVDYELYELHMRDPYRAARGPMVSRGASTAILS